MILDIDTKFHINNNIEEEISDLSFYSSIGIISNNSFSINQNSFNEDYTIFYNIADNFIDEYQLLSIIQNLGKQKKNMKLKIDKENKKGSFELKEEITFMTRKNKDSGDGDGDKPKNNNIENKPNLNFNKNDIYNEALRWINDYPDITIDIELGYTNIRNYFNHIQNSGFFGGEIEISIAVYLYNINIATSKEIRNEKDNIICYTYIRYYDSNDEQENRHLMILTNRNHNHFNLIYYNNKLIYYKFIIEDIYINELTYLNKVFKIILIIINRINVSKKAKK